MSRILIKLGPIKLPIASHRDHPLALFTLLLFIFFIFSAYYFTGTREFGWKGAPKERSLCPTVVVYVSGKENEAHKFSNSNLNGMPTKLSPNCLHFNKFYEWLKMKNKR